MYFMVMTKFRGNKVRKQSWNESFFFTASNVETSGFSLMWKVNGKNKWTNERMRKFSLSQDLYIPVDNIC